VSSPLGRPAVSVPVQHVSGTPGRTVALKCEVEAYPRADIVWIKRGEIDEIETSGRYSLLDIHLY
jgi:hypothetical protein